MIARLVALVILVAVLAGGVWYILRDTPQKKVLRWRESVEFYVEKASDLDTAEAINERILKLAPSSTPDLVMKARIEERRGTPESCAAALLTYDKILAREGDRALHLNLNRIRLLRMLGRVSEAQGIALSFMDSFPFEATTELGRMALDALDPLDALKHFSRAAQRYAKDDRQRAVANESLASAYALLVDLNSTPLSVVRPDLQGKELEEAQAKRQEFVETAKQRYLSTIDNALDLTKKVQEEPDTKLAVRVSIADLYEKRARFSPAGATPYYDAVKTLQTRISVNDTAAELLPAELLARMGCMRLLAATLEKDRLLDRTDAQVNELLASAEKDFVNALRNVSVDEARRMLQLDVTKPPQGKDFAVPAPDPDIARRRSYIENLGFVARAFLASPLGARVLEDSSTLALAARVRDGREARDPEVGGGFSAVTAMAYLQRDEADKAVVFLDQLIAASKPAARPEAALVAAEQSSASASGRRVALGYFDRLPQLGAKSTSMLERRARFLLSLATRDPTLAAETSTRLDALLAAAVEETRTPTEHIAMAEFLSNIRGQPGAENALRRAHAQFPDDFAIAFQLANNLILKGSAQEKRGQREEAGATYRDALSLYLRVLVGNPAESIALSLQTRFWLQRLEEEFALDDIAPLLRPIFPNADAAAMTTFAQALRAFLKADFDSALERVAAISAASHFEPFLSLMRGYCHAERANDVVQSLNAQTETGTAYDPKAYADATARSAQELELARKAFLERADSVAHQFELFSLEVHALIREQKDVPDELVARLRKLVEAHGAKHQPHWLEALALEQRFRQRFKDLSVKNSELGRLLTNTQRALRKVIERQPRFTPAYHRLAESFLISERLDQQLAQKRELFKADYPRAVQTLESVLSPDLQTLELLAAYHDLDKAPEKARRYRMVRCVVSGSPTAFTDFVANCLKSGESALVEILTRERKPGEPATSSEAQSDEAKAFTSQVLYALDRTTDLGGQRIAVLLGLLEEAEKGRVKNLVYRVLTELFLRRMFEKLPEAEALALMYHGLALSLEEPAARKAAEKESLRARIAEAFAQSLELFDTKKLAAPLILLNNLAWHLSESPSEADRAKALAIAERARDRLANTDDRSDVLDTYAWALLRNRRLVEARKVLQDILSVKESPTYRYHLAQVLFELRVYDEARIEIDKSLDSILPFAEKVEAQKLRNEITEAKRQALGDSAAPN